MEWSIIGLSVGTVLALTGAGGSILAIPLFITLLNMPLMMATTSSLIVVVVAALIGATTLPGKTNVKVALLLFLSSTFGAWGTLPIKSAMPEIALKLLLAFISLYSLLIMWRPINYKLSLKRPFVLHLIGGFILGGLTTLTGLGGGVVLVPWLKVSTGKVDIVTSLTTIALISSFSLTLQVASGASFPSFKNVMLVMFAIAFATFVVKKMATRISEVMLLKVRLYTFSFVVAFTLTSLFGI